MKRILATILAFVYISTSTGATIRLHYCMGHLAEWGFGHVKSNTCGQCGMDENDASRDGCCTNELTFIKNVNDQRTVEFSFQSINKPVAFLPALYTAVRVPPLSSGPELHPLINTQPRIHDIALYLHNRSLLI